MVRRAIGIAAVVAVAAAACGKGSGSAPAVEVGAERELVDVVRNVGTWRATPQKADKAAWLRAHVAWDVVGAVAMTWAAVELAKMDPGKLEPSLRSGLAEIQKGPGDAVVGLAAKWAAGLGRDACTIAPAPAADAAWARGRLTLPPPPAGVAPDVADTLGALATRARAVTGFDRVDCGGKHPLIIGHLGDALVPLPKD
jgi:hypothetical protein